MNKFNPVPHKVIIHNVGDLADAMNKNMEIITNQFIIQDKMIRKLKGKLIFGRVVAVIFAGYVFYKFQDQDLKYEALDKDIRRMKEATDKE